MFLKILIVATGLLSLSVAGLMLNILIRKGGKFPAYRVGHNREMARIGITCVKHEEIQCLKAGQVTHLKSVKSNAESGEPEMCAGCQQLV